MCKWSSLFSSSLEREREREMKSSGSNGSSVKIDRKTVEKNRRIHMKGLCFKLASLIPKENNNNNNNNSKDAMAQHDHLDQAATYIKKLRARIESLKQRKNYATSSEGSDREVDFQMTNEFGLPVIEVRYQTSILEVILITTLKKKFMFYEVIGLLEEEGADVVNASFSVVSDKIFYTIHSQAISSTIEASRVCERIRELIQ